MLKCSKKSSEFIHGIPKTFYFKEIELFILGLKILLESRRQLICESEKLPFQKFQFFSLRFRDSFLNGATTLDLMTKRRR
jgi:hypothetical protein